MYALARRRWNNLICIMSQCPGRRGCSRDHGSGALRRALITTHPGMQQAHIRNIPDTNVSLLLVERVTIGSITWDVVLTERTYYRGNDYRRGMNTSIRITNGTGPFTSSSAQLHLPTSTLRVSMRRCGCEMKELCEVGAKMSDG